MRTTCVSSHEVDQYLADLEGPKRSALQRLRQTILEVIPEAEEGNFVSSPGVQGRREGRRRFAAFKNHLSYVPHSGSVFPLIYDEIAAYGRFRTEARRGFLADSGLVLGGGSSPLARHLRL